MLSLVNCGPCLHRTTKCYNKNFTQAYTCLTFKNINDDNYTWAENCNYWIMQ